MEIITTSSIGLSDPEANETEALAARLNALVISREGTLPGNRNFGLPGNFISMPQRQAQNILAIELQEKADEYFPDITIKSVAGSFGGDGAEDIHITVERSET